MVVRGLLSSGVRVSWLAGSFFILIGVVDGRERPSVHSRAVLGSN
jgi:hypothetical protein